MNILFIYSLYDIASIDKPLKTPELMNFGISYISSLLKKHGHITKLVVLSCVSGNNNKALLDENIKNLDPKLICFTAVSSEYTFITSLAKYIKNKYPNIYLLIGGVHVSLNPEKALDNFDALCIGEGEYPVLELVSQIEKRKHPSLIPNLWIKHEEEIEKNQTRPILQNLDELPFPDREMWQEWIDEDPNARHAVLLGRGCPFNCTYCSNHALRKLANGIYTRYRSPHNILDEIKELAAKYQNKKEIYFEVETIGANKEWAIKLCYMLEQYNKTLNPPLTFGVNLRITPKMDTDPLFAAFKNANFRFVNIGLESGSERIRHDILNRNYSNEDILGAVESARKYGLQISLLNMMGLPDESFEDFKETVKMNRLCLPDWTSVSIFYPYPGTSLYAVCEKKGLLKSSIDAVVERKMPVLDLPKFNKKQINNEYLWFEFNVYKGHKRLIGLLISLFKKILWQKIELNSSIFFLYRSIRHKSRLFKK